MISILWPIVRSQGFRRIVLQQLMNLTARALGIPSMRIWTLSNDKALRVYAEFTRDNLQTLPMDMLIGRMNGEAYKMGRLLRRVFCLRKQENVQRMIVELYRHIGIKLEGQIPGQLCFRQCFFSRYYTPEVCLAASALDEGIMRGLAGDGKLFFQQRITEGCNHCIATYK